MNHPDLNLLITLEALLNEGSVAGAARKLRLSPSAMSRALSRLRSTTGDPLLVRAGRGLVPSPRALELKARITPLVSEAQSTLKPAAKLDPKSVSRIFSIRTSEGFVESFGPELLAQLDKEAPGIRLRFLQKPDKSSNPLREGAVDLETGVLESTTAPELRTQALFTDRLVGVVHLKHPLTRSPVTPARFAAGKHICVSRQGFDRGPIDDTLSHLGYQRNLVTVVGGFSTALALARSTDLIASVPERHTAGLRAGLHTFVLPFKLPTFAVSLLWHPRMDSDPTHQWLRNQILNLCSGRFGKRSNVF